MKVSANSIAELQCQIPEPPHYIKCLAVHPEPGRHGDVRVAVGQANGRVSLLSFVPQMSGHAIKEFGPKQVTLSFGCQFHQPFGAKDKWAGSHCSAVITLHHSVSLTKLHPTLPVNTTRSYARRHVPVRTS